MAADCPFADPSVGPQLANLIHTLMQIGRMAAVPLRGEPAVLVASDDLRGLRVDGHAGPTRLVRTAEDLVAAVSTVPAVGVGR
jgi:hypothetical protein